MQPGAAVHAVEQRTVLLRKLDIDASPQQGGRAGELSRQVLLAAFDRLACAHRRRHAASKESREARITGDRLLVHGVEAKAHDLGIGTARTETKGALGSARLQIACLRGQIVKQRSVRLKALAGAETAGIGDQFRLDAAKLGMQALRFRQAEHGEGAIGFQLQQALDDRPGLLRLQPAIDHQQARISVAILAKIGCDDAASAGNFRDGERARIKAGQKLGDRPRVGDQIEAGGHHQRTRRLEGLAKRRLRRQRPGAAARVPAIGGEFGVALPAQSAAAEIDDMMARIRGRLRQTVADAQCGEALPRRAGMAGIGHEGIVQDDARRFHHMERPRMDLVQHRASKRMILETSWSLAHSALVPHPTD